MDDNNNTEKENSEDSYNGVSGMQRDSFVGRMNNHCQRCETPLRRRERLTEHTHSPRRLAVEAVIKCDCAERVIATKNISKADTCDGWY